VGTLSRIGLCFLFLGAVGGCSNGSGCTSDPVPQLRINGITYIDVTGDRAVASELGPQIGTITAGLPAAAETCGQYSLKDGQGTPPVGSKVYEITGTDPKVAVAVSNLDHLDVFTVDSARARSAPFPVPGVRVGRT